MWKKNGSEVFLSREKIDESKYGLDNPNFFHGRLIYKCRNNNYESMRSILVNKNIYIYILVFFVIKLKLILNVLQT